MAILSSMPVSQSPTSSLRLPAQKRISTPASQRLSTITEGSNVRPVRPPRSLPRSSASSVVSAPISAAARWPSQDSLGGRSQGTQKSAPPAYEWVAEPIDRDQDLRAPVEDEKLARLRRGGNGKARWRDRGGWGRLLLIIGLVLLVIVALAVGLSVGLTRKRDVGGSGSTVGEQTDQPGGTTTSPERLQSFPLSEYSMVTALRTVTTNCTSNPSTWRCYPDTIYNASDASSGLATFNWILSNTSATYATNTTTVTTGDRGIPSNLTISSTNNPFSVTFTNQSLIYINNPTNSTSARLTFTFNMHKAVIPSTSITSNNAAAECFYNQTIFTGTLYLSAARTYLSGDLADSTGVGEYTPWPYAVEITQSSAGGEGVPACYETVNGVAGARILTGLEAQAETDNCSCDYRNY